MCASTTTMPPKSGSAKRTRPITSTPSRPAPSSRRSRRRRGEAGHGCRARRGARRLRQQRSQGGRARSALGALRRARPHPLLPALAIEHVHRRRFVAPPRPPPTRAGPDPHHRLRPRDLTPRSSGAFTTYLATMRAAALDAVAHGTITATVESATAIGDAGVELRGRVSSLPNFVEDDGG